MKTIRRVMAVALVLALAGFAGNAMAQAKPAGGAANGNGQKAQVMTHGELAQLLVEKLGLYRLLPANASVIDYIMLLMQNGIYPSPTLQATAQTPAPGWSLDGTAEVTLADLAVVLVRALRLEDQVKGDRGDVQNWLNALKDINVPVDSVGAGVATLTPLSETLVNLPIFQTTIDPLVRRYIPFPEIIPPTVKEVRVPAPVIVTREQGPKPKPVTPN